MSFVSTSGCIKGCLCLVNVVLAGFQFCASWWKLLVYGPRPTTAWDNLIKDWLNWIWRHTMSQLLQSIFTPGRRRAELAGGGKFPKVHHSNGDGADKKRERCVKLFYKKCLFVLSQILGKLIISDISQCFPYNLQQFPNVLQKYFLKAKFLMLQFWICSHNA